MEFVAYKNGFTFKDFYIQYARFHFNQTNNILHVIGIPLIACTIQTISSEVNWIDLLHLNSLARHKMSNDYVFENTRNEDYDPVVVFWVGLCSIYAYLDVTVGITCFVVGMANYMGFVTMLIRDR